MADHDALESALQKIAGLELTDDEVNALAEALASNDDVEGFAMSPAAGKGWIIIESIIPETPIPQSGMLTNELASGKKAR